MSDSTRTNSTSALSTLQRKSWRVHWLLLLLLATLAFSLTACGGGEEEASTTSESLTSDLADPNTTNTGDEKATAAGVINPDERPIYISSLRNNLNRLNSYRITMSFSWEGATQSGATANGTIEMIENIVSGQGQYTKFGISRDTVSDGDIEVYNIGDLSYVYTTQAGTPQCVAAKFANVAAESIPSFSPIELVGKIEEAAPAGQKEAVNGLLSEHYRVTKFGQMLAQLDAVPEKNDLWVAQQGGYVMKYTGEATGDLGWLDKDLAQATIRWQYNLLEVDQLTSIDLPAICQLPQFSLDIPLPANATNKNVGDGVINFDSPDSVQQVANFYRDELPVMGWSLGVGEVTEQAANVVFSMETRTLTLVVTPSENGSAIMMQESKQ